MTNTRSTIARIEHANISVADADQLASKLIDIFDWKIRWYGPSMDEGYTVHVGSEGDGSSYFALYSPKHLIKNEDRDHRVETSLNHVGIEVGDLAVLEARLHELGYKTFNHRDYGACNSFYFLIDPYLELEVIQYK